MRLFVILASIVANFGLSFAEESEVFPRGRHDLETPCNPQTWQNFHQDRNKLLEIVVDADPNSDLDELNDLLAQGQQSIISKNYTDICNFYQYLECKPNKLCECVQQAPPFNFVLNNGECRGERGALCDSDREGNSHFACMPGLECKIALPGNTAICGGKAAFEEELETFKQNGDVKKNEWMLKNGGSVVSALYGFVVLAIASLLAASFVIF